MDDQTKKLLAAAVVGGYVLGRTKKGRLALTAVTFLTGRKLALDPRQLVAEGIRRIGDLPQVAELQEQLREEGLEAGRKALAAVADRGLGSLADTIGSRTAGLGLGGDDEDDEDDEDEEDEYEGEDEEEEEPDEEPDEEEEEEEESPRRRPGSGGSRRPAPAERRSVKKAAPARKAAPAKKAAAKKPPAEREAAKKSSPAQRPASSSPKKAAKKTSPHSNRRR